MTGKYRWTREIPPAPEWFDLDRSEKMYPEGEFPPDDDVHDDFGFESAAKCPMCESFLAEYEGEAYDDEHHEGSAYRCLDCGHHFTDSDRYMMD